MRIIATAVLMALTLVELTQAEPRKRHESKNYIIDVSKLARAQACQRSTHRGRREIDIYRNGLMFEKDNVVGVVPRR